MPTLLRNLTIDRVASVDKGAGDGVHVVFWKRAAANQHADGYANSVTKREFTQAERDAAEAKGHAMPGGGYPINNVADLKNAIQAIGRAKDPAKAKAHIKSRARALGRSDLIPDTWGGSKRFEPSDADRALAAGIVTSSIAKDDYGMAVPANLVLPNEATAVSFEDAIDGAELSDDARELLCCVRYAVCALDESICSILGDDECQNKRELIDESFTQFHQYLADLGLDEVGKQLVIAKGGSEPMPTAVTNNNAPLTVTAAQVNELIAKHVKEAVAPLRRENAILKMSAKHKEYHDQMDGGADAKDKFADMSPDERDKHMSDNPIKKGVEATVADLVGKALAPFAKQLETAVGAVTKITADSRLEDARKRCAELGLPADHAETYLKAQSGDREAFAAHEAAYAQVIKARTAQAALGSTWQGGLFAEIGKSGGGATAPTAYGQLMAKAHELQAAVAKSGTGKSMSEAQAFAKIYNDPSNRELVEAHKAEEVRSRMGRAA